MAMIDRGKLCLIPLELIDPPLTPSRSAMDPERVGALADDIAANGLLQQLGLTGPGDDGRYRVAYGHRRWMALHLLKWSEVPAKVWPAGTDPDELRVSENNIREQLSPLEEAAEVKRFLDKGIPHSGIARMFRRSAAWVAERLELLELPADLRAAIEEKHVSLAVARILGDVDHADYRGSLIAEAHRTGATAATANVWRAHYLADKERIVENHMMVDQIVEARGAWKIVVPCELCNEDKEYTATRSLRVCHTCLEALEQLIADAAKGYGIGSPTVPSPPVA